MSISEILRHTPTWVWLLLAFLLYRGLKAMVPRTMAPRRMLILPVVFFVWAVHGMLGELGALGYALTGFGVALVVGVLFGRYLGYRQAAPEYDPGHGVIRRPGSVVTLVLIVVAFVSKYTLSVYLAYRPELAVTVGYCGLYGALSGLTDGVFWGVMFTQLGRAIRGAGIAPTPANLLQVMFAESPAAEVSGRRR
ncbi:MAG: hypothetical protein P8011_11495 [Acidihalobacter sp.]|uniref:DUF6622 family protein n=1 Tax=Acidihalobacter sp. TaxID=1872108 RepID=UPI00307E22E8